VVTKSYPSALLPFEDEAGCILDADAICSVRCHLLGEDRAAGLSRTPATLFSDETNPGSIGQILGFA